MKKLLKIVSFIGVFFLTFYLSNLVLNIKRDKEIEYKTAIKFDVKEHDFKKLKKGIPVSKFFVYENIGDKALRIKNVDSRCGCTIPKWSRKKLNPGERDSILVQYDSKKEGYFSKDVYIISNSDTSPDILYISGVVSE
ncbi:MAG: DUF1573 domain-containing protein [Tenacibaculum sp.]|nr:DUF1573 domain-containing protein [Tenacibaculum sp.]